MNAPVWVDPLLFISETHHANMLDVMPHSPAEDRPIIKLTGPVADLCVRVAFDDFAPPKPTFAHLIGGTWGNIPLDAFEGTIEDRGLCLGLTLHPKSV